jgi:hypothetical protein
MPKIINAMQAKAGAKVEHNKMGTLEQPTQFLPEKKKDKDWAAWNIDWIEVQGQKQLKRNARRLLKNYKLAKGIIDKTDYIVEEDNQYADLVDQLTETDVSALEIKFYPIIPNVINVLMGEFASKYAKVTFRAVDDISYNEMLEQKRAMVEETLLADAASQMLNNLIQAGADMQDPEIQKLLSKENLKTLPEIEDFFRKDYRSLVEEWANHQLKVDEERFKMYELEERAFRDMLITDREFWHFRMGEDDYEVELWNPVLTFYHKSPDNRYISQANWVGKSDMMSVADVIDKYGYLMTEKQLKELENVYPARSAGYAIPGTPNDGSFYDGTRSHAWNSIDNGSLGYRQFVANHELGFNGGGDIVDWILGESEDLFDFGKTFMLRVSTIYWKTQRRVGHLTKILEDGTVIQDIVADNYIVIDKPLYNTNVSKQKTKENLIFGDHIDWIWINDVWGGIKIGPNHPTYWGMTNPDGIQPIYLGIDKPEPGRLKFQFKGDSTLYGCKLPVEGAVFSDRNTKSVSLVDLMKPYQIGYNIVNNQIADILVDELGTVIMLDQNAIPRHSLGEDWGKNNLAKAYVAMKDFQMLPLDTSITNTENALNFQHYQVLNLEQTNRLLSRTQLANYFKNQAFESIGVNAQRLGGAMEQQTATGVQASLESSYAQTESYFIQHSDHLMPRVHQMRTDLAQYYHSTNPSVRLSYITTEAEKVNFTINGTDLLLRDFNVFCTTKANHRRILEQLKQMALTNNTTGASIYDLGNVIKSESIAEVTGIMKAAEEKQIQERQANQQQLQQLEQQRMQLEAQEKELARQFEAEQNDKDRQVQLMTAEIKSAGYGAMQDINQNQMSDYQDVLKDIKETERYQAQMEVKKESENNKKLFNQQQIALKREELETKKAIANTQLEIARENKNKYDIPQRKSSDKKEK